MKRYDDQRLTDIEDAVTAIRAHLTRSDLSDGLVFDAVRIRLLEIGEAVKAITPALLGTEPEIPWKNIAALRDQLAHRYFDTEHAIVGGTVAHDLEPFARCRPSTPGSDRIETVTAPASSDRAGLSLEVCWGVGNGSRAQAVAPTRSSVFGRNGRRRATSTSPQRHR